LAGFKGISEGHQGVQENVGSGIEIASVDSGVGENNLEGVGNSEHALSGGVDLDGVIDSDFVEESFEERRESLVFIVIDISVHIKFHESGEVGINKAKGSVNQNSQIFSNSIRAGTTKGVEDGLGHELD